MYEGYKGMHTGVGDLDNTRMVLDRLKSEKRDLADQLESAKSSRVELNKKCKESLSDQKERRKLARRTGKDQRMNSGLGRNRSHSNSMTPHSQTSATWSRSDFVG